MKAIMISILLFGLALADLSCDCGKRNAGRLTGAKDTRKNEYPWMVALQTIYSSFTFCGGTIVTPFHVVTASHCIENRQAFELVLVVGAHDINNFTDSTRQEVLVDEIIGHLYYNRATMNADIAVLVTATEMIFNQFVSPACMPNKRIIDDLDGQTVKIIGWGTDDHTRPNLKVINKLMELDLQVTTIRYCEGTIGDKICTFSLGKDPCRGDSGGPVVWLDPETNRFTLVGVVSYGPTECGKTLFPSVQTNVSFYKDWINMRIRYSHRGTVNTCSKI